MAERLPFRIWASFDTETTNYEDENGAYRAVPILYIFDDVHDVPMSEYYIDHPDEHISFFRHEQEMQEAIDSIVYDGLMASCIPVICAYNLIFDLQTIMAGLHERYEMEVNAQSSTNVYTLDLLMDGVRVLRFWDTYHLEMRGLKAMGRTCGVAKLLGDWDYDLIRTPDTELTELELGYAARDVQVICAYLRYLCDANEWLTPDMLGNTVLTKTSIVRQMAKREIGQTKVKKGLTMQREFENLCRRELPQSFESYALRLACFVGGFTFTAAKTASQVLRHVCSLDETSAHHAFLNGRRVPVNFHPLPTEICKLWLWDIERYTMRDVLHRYAYPFQRWFHMQIRLDNVRLKAGSAFEHWGIGLFAQAKFARVAIRSDDGGDNERHLASEDDIRSRGYVNSALNPVFAFGKLMSADSVIMHLDELEYWCALQVYDFDSVEPLQGEGTIKSMWPPDYVTAQSNLLFGRKNDAKVINGNYVEGAPYTGELPDTIPMGIAEGLLNGELSHGFVESWYQSTVKGSFNGIYGTQAQNTLKPEYMVCSDAELAVNQDSKCTPETFDERLSKQKHPMVLYPYGMRIVGGSRMQLIIAIMLLFERLQGRVDVTGGDTDSIKIRCDEDVDETDLLEALEPLHTATTNALNLSMNRLRKRYPQYASGLEHVGCFEIEPPTKGSVFYALHMEAWNKARLSIDEEGRAHITCAGLSRPQGAYTIEDWFDGMLARGFAPEKLLPLTLGYNVTITGDVCHALEHHKPLFADEVHTTMTDYQGNTSDIHTHEGIALYPTARKLGDTLKRVNQANVDYVRDTYGREIDTTERVITVDYNLPLLFATIMQHPVTVELVNNLNRHFYIPRLYRQTPWGMEEVEP